MTTLGNHTMLGTMDFTFRELMVSVNVFLCILTSRYFSPKHTSTYTNPRFLHFQYPLIRVKQKVMDDKFIKNIRQFVVRVIFSLPLCLCGLFPGTSNYHDIVVLLMVSPYFKLKF